MEYTNTNRVARSCKSIGDQAELTAQLFYFLGVTDKMELKPPMSYEEQWNKLIFHGIVVDDKENALNVLKRVNYYRFAGYALQFRVKPEDSTYIEGTSFNRNPAKIGKEIACVTSRWNTYAIFLYRKVLLVIESRNLTQSRKIEKI